ncbi:hypothetical protein [Catellatospora sp. NPDC049609]|uniref:hypothetical protein n=1 Tax=Catellatospora sp. NPDC049609 TaxID=3155505 RepID=UPI00343D70E0
MPPAKRTTGPPPDPAPADTTPPFPHRDACPSERIETYAALDPAPPPDPGALVIVMRCVGCGAAVYERE